ncbi:MFS transporter [Micromonospora sp. ATA32]|nr:MFS transporter [Micromonospora sp. ATA32]
MQSKGTQADTWMESRRRLLPAMVVGTILEWYDLFIYAQAAALVFGVLFFPQFSSGAATLAAFATFGVGYLARPLGAVVFGHIGDKYGRKRALVTTLILMGFSTTAVGFLPTYTSIGIAAPLLLVLLRLLQGLGAGAEYAGAFVMVAEVAPARRRGFWTSVPGVGLYGGVLLASLVAAFVFTLPKETLYAWGWRVPFLISFVLIGVGLYMRLRVVESPVYEEMAERKAVRRLPIITVFREAPKRLFLAVLLTAPIAFHAYIGLTYALTYSAQRGATAKEAVIGTVLASTVALVSVPIAGRLSDRFGRRPVYLVLAAASGVIAFPYFLLLSTGEPALIWLAQAALMGPAVFALTGAQAAFLAELFDSRYRYSGVAMSREISTAALSAPAPVIAISLANLSGGDPWLTAGVMVLISAACFVAVLVLPETRGRDMSVDAEASAAAAHVAGSSMTGAHNHG